MTLGRRVYRCVYTRVQEFAVPPDTLEEQRSLLRLTAPLASVALTLSSFAQLLCLLPLALGHSDWPLIPVHLSLPLLLQLQTLVVPSATGASSISFSLVPLSFSSLSPFASRTAASGAALSRLQLQHCLAWRCRKSRCACSSGGATRMMRSHSPLLLLMMMVVSDCVSVCPAAALSQGRPHC